MPKHIEGSLTAKGLKFAIVLSRFNNFIGERLLDGAVDAIVRHGGADDAIHVFRVPGAFEIPQIFMRYPKGEAEPVPVPIHAPGRGRDSDAEGRLCRPVPGCLEWTGGRGLAQLWYS